MKSLRVFLIATLMGAVLFTMESTSLAEKEPTGVAETV